MSTQGHQLELENHFDGPIPDRLRLGQTERELMIQHQRRMIGFHQTRIADFRASLERILARPPHEEGRTEWIVMTEKTIRYHVDQCAEHRARLAELEG